MKFDVLDRYTGEVKFTAEIECKEDALPSLVRDDGRNDEGGGSIRGRAPEKCDRRVEWLRFQRRS